MTAHTPKTDSHHLTSHTELTHTTATTGDTEKAATRSTGGPLLASRIQRLRPSLQFGVSMCALAKPVMSLSRQKGPAVTTAQWRLSYKIDAVQVAACA